MLFVIRLLTINFKRSNRKILPTEYMTFVPISITNFEIIATAIIALEDVQGRDVQDNSFSVGSSDSPLASFSINYWRTVRVIW